MWMGSMAVAGTPWRRWLACVVGAWLLGVAACSYPQSPLLGVTREPLHTYPTGSDLRLPAKDKLVVIGDVQRTSLLEHSVLGRELNDREQLLLLKDIGAQSFDAMVLLGDMAFDGSDDAWAHFDALMAPLRAPSAGAGPNPRLFFPVMGNHDYSAGSGTQIRRRFPDLGGATHWSFLWGSVRMIVLDGNREQLCHPDLRQGPVSGCDTEWQAQLRWLQNQLQIVDESADERGAILFVHQSPYTQSPWVEEDQYDARAFALALLASRRGLALISAHAHGFERYRYVRYVGDLRPPKEFVVSAGGGGPRPSERREGAEKDESELRWPRPFNYLMLEQTDSTVEVSVRGIDKNVCAVQALDREHRTFRFN
jgi:hypothetical protein